MWDAAKESRPEDMFPTTTTRPAKEEEAEGARGPPAFGSEKEHASSLKMKLKIPSAAAAATTTTRKPTGVEAPAGSSPPALGLLRSLIHENIVGPSRHAAVTVDTEA